MLDLMRNQVRVKGSMYTLDVAARGQGIDETAAQLLLRAMNLKLGSAPDETGLPDVVSLDNIVSAGFGTVQLLIDNGLVTEVNNNHYKVTERAVNLLKEAAKIQVHLDAEGFSVCGCVHC